MTEASQNTPTVFSLNDVALRANKLILETEETPKQHQFQFIKIGTNRFLLRFKIHSRFCTQRSEIGSLPLWWADEDGIKALGLPDGFRYTRNGKDKINPYLESFEMNADSPNDAMVKLDALENAVPDGSGTSQLDRVQYCIRDMCHMISVHHFLPDMHPEHQRKWAAQKGETEPETAARQQVSKSIQIFDKLLRENPAYQAWDDYIGVLDKLPLAQALRALKEPEERYAETAAVMRGDIARRYPLLKGELGFREVCQP